MPATISGCCWPVRPSGCSSRCRWPLGSCVGAARTLSVGLVAYVGGAVVAATAHAPLVFAVGQFVGGLWLRRRRCGWCRRWSGPRPRWRWSTWPGGGGRWPIVLIGRLLVGRAAAADGDVGVRPLGRTLLIPLGVGGMVSSSGYWWAAAVITAEAFGGLLGRAGGGAVGLVTAYGLFAAALFAAAIVGRRRSQAAG